MSISGVIELNEGATGRSSFNASITTQTNWHITHIEVSIEDTRTQAQIDTGIIAEFYLGLTVDGTTYSATVEVEGARKYYDFPIVCNVPAGSTIYFKYEAISGSSQYCRGFYAPVTSSFYGGYTGSGDYPTSSDLADAKIYITYDPIWTIDGSNDGYPYPIGTTPEKFDGFPLDADGYPYNWGVWKLDNQNDGYPWIVGYLPARHMGAGILVKEQNQWRNAGVVIYQNSTYRIGNVLIYKN